MFAESYLRERQTAALRGKLTLACAMVYLWVQLGFYVHGLLNLRARNLIKPVKRTKLLRLCFSKT